MTLGNPKESPFLACTPLQVWYNRGMKNQTLLREDDWKHAELIYTEGQEGWCYAYQTEYGKQKDEWQISAITFATKEDAKRHISLMIRNYPRSFGNTGFMVARCTVERYS